MKHFVRGLGCTWAALWLSLSAPAITNVPPGVTVWLQGYDLNPASPPFRNEGIVKLEAIDDSLNVGLLVTGSGMVNAPGGLLLFLSGAGGGRLFAGHLQNQGVVRVDAGTIFGGTPMRVENTGDFLVSVDSRVEFHGPETVYAQYAGNLNCGYGFKVIGGRFEYFGGVIEGEPQLIRSQLYLSASVSNACTMAILGEGGGLEGHLALGQTLRIAGSTNYGPANARVTNSFHVSGRLVLTSTNGEAPAILTTDDLVLVTTNGVVEAVVGEGGEREIQGALEVHGRLEVRAPLLLSSESPLMNYGTILIGTGSTLTLRRPGQLSQGTVEHRHGTLRGHGTVLADVNNAATLLATTAAAPLVIVGDLNQAPEGRVEIDFDADEDDSELQLSLPTGSPATARQTRTLNSRALESGALALRIEGGLNLDGTLAVALPRGFAADVGQRLTLLEATTVRGAFKRLEFPRLPGDRHWEVFARNGTLVAEVLAGGPPLSLDLARALDGVPRLRVHGAPADAVVVETSGNLRTWEVFTGRLELADGETWIGGLPTPDPGAARFFRVLLRP